MEIKVFKSEFTGELFEDKEQYTKHVEEYLYKNEKHEVEEPLLKEKDQISNNCRLTAVDIQDFKNKYIEAINRLNINNEVKLLYLDFRGMCFSETVINSHSAPINGIQNWERTDNKPKSYPGFEGVIVMVLTETVYNVWEDRRRLENLINKFPGINIGSGGYCGDIYNNVEGCVIEYKLRLFLEDFPLISSSYQEFLKLSDLKDRWTNDVYWLYNNKNKEDKILATRRENYSELTNRIDDLTKKRLEVGLIIGNIEDRNRADIISENPFTYEIKLAVLSTTFRKY